MLPSRLGETGEDRVSVCRQGAPTGGCPSRKTGARTLIALVALTAVALVVTIGAAAAGEQLKICPSGCAYSTIQAALTDAQAGATIEMGGPRAAADFSISESVTLAGAGAEQTTIGGGSSVNGANVSATIIGVRSRAAPPAASAAAPATRAS